MSCHLWKPKHSWPSSQQPVTELYSDSEESVSDGEGRGGFQKAGNFTLTRLISRQELLPTHNLTSYFYGVVFNIILVITPSGFRTKTVYSSTLARILHAHPLQPPRICPSNYVWLAALQRGWLLWRSASVTNSTETSAHWPAPESASLGASRSFVSPSIIT
jgi:hypothetical protein